MSNCKLNTFIQTALGNSYSIQNCLKLKKYLSSIVYIELNYIVSNGYQKLSNKAYNFHLMLACFQQKDIYIFHQYLQNNHLSNMRMNLDYKKRMQNRIKKCKLHTNYLLKELFRLLCISTMFLENLKRNSDYMLDKSLKYMKSRRIQKFIDMSCMIEACQ